MMTELIPIESNKIRILLIDPIETIRSRRQMKEIIKSARKLYDQTSIDDNIKLVVALSRKELNYLSVLLLPKLAYSINEIYELKAVSKKDQLDAYWESAGIAFGQSYLCPDRITQDMIVTPYPDDIMKWWRGY